MVEKNPWSPPAAPLCLNVRSSRLGSSSARTERRRKVASERGGEATSPMTFKGRTASSEDPRPFQFHAWLSSIRREQRTGNVFFFFARNVEEKALRRGFHGNPTVLAAVPGFPLEKKEKVVISRLHPESEKRWKWVEMILTLLFFFCLFCFLIPDFSQFHSQHPGESRSSKLRPVCSFWSVHSVPPSSLVPHGPSRAVRTSPS